jgi:hypothetical protein
VKKLEGKPFALLGINTDVTKDTVAELTRKGEITWRCCWDGGQEGPITTRWRVESFPTVFVLDARGVVRFKNLRGETLEEAVNNLIREAEAATGK